VTAVVDKHSHPLSQSTTKNVVIDKKSDRRGAVQSAAAEYRPLALRFNVAESLMNVMLKLIIS
jgi:hypothetical protein